MWEEFCDVVIDTLVDGAKLFPFLFLTYLVMEFLQHRTSDRTRAIIRKSGKAGPFLGALLGAFPQCGFSTVASNFYAGRVITMGTLIAIFLSTSDEMIPVFLSSDVSILLMIELIGAKIVIGMIAGFIIDVIVNSANDKKSRMMGMAKIGKAANMTGCTCGQTSIFWASVRHTFITFAYIIAVSFVLNIVIAIIGEDTLGNIILNKPVIGHMIATLVGLIPNCAASVVLTQLYIGGVMSLGAMMSGLLAGAGVGILVLFRENKRPRENVKIVVILYGIGVFCGLLIDAVGFLL